MTNRSEGSRPNGVFFPGARGRGGPSLGNSPEIGLDFSTRNGSLFFNMNFDMNLIENYMILIWKCMILIGSWNCMILKRFWSEWGVSPERRIFSRVREGEGVRHREFPSRFVFLCFLATLSPGHWGRLEEMLGGIVGSERGIVAPFWCTWGVICWISCGSCGDQLGIHWGSGGDDLGLILETFWDHFWALRVSFVG